MSKITIVRPYEWYHQSYINIFIDEVKVGDLGIGKTKSFKVPPGTHEVALKKRMVDRSKPIILDLNPNENKTISVSSVKYGWLIGPLFFLVLYGIYYLTIGFLGLKSFFLGEVLAFSAMIALFLFLYSRYYYYKIEEVEEDIEFTEENVQASQST